jgi:hypothetical protein
MSQERMLADSGLGHLTQSRVRSVEIFLSRNSGSLQTYTRNTRNGGEPTRLSAGFV